MAHWLWPIFHDSPPMDRGLIADGQERSAVPRTPDGQPLFSWKPWTIKHQPSTANCEPRTTSRRSPGKKQTNIKHQLSTINLQASSTNHPTSSIEHQSTIKHHLPSIMFFRVSRDVFGMGVLFWDVGKGLKWVREAVCFFVQWFAHRMMIDWLIDWSIDWSIDWLINCSIDWLIDWLID